MGNLRGRWPTLEHYMVQYPPKIAYPQIVHNMVHSPAKVPGVAVLNALLSYSLPWICVESAKVP